MSTDTLDVTPWTCVPGTLSDSAEEELAAVAALRALRRPNKAGRGPK